MVVDVVAVVIALVVDAAVVLERSSISSISSSSSRSMAVSAYDCIG